MSRIRNLSPRIQTIDTRAVKPPPKTVDPHYLTPEHRAWREEVIARAGRRCEWLGPNSGDGRAGTRCEKSEPAHRMFADHIVERGDGGAQFDPANGMCLCGAHHSLKTARARAARMQRGVGV